MKYFTQPLDHANLGHGRKIIVVGTIAAIVALGVGFSAYYILAQSSSGSPQIRSITFVPGWHYVGSVNLKGEQSSCSQLRLPCPTNPSNQADEYSNGSTTAYVEGAGLGAYTIVLINATLYCISPPVSWTQQCPTQIGESTGLYVYQSDLFNQENACNSFSTIENNGSTPGLASLIASIESYPKFISLEGNRTFQYASGGCGTVETLGLGFSYYDTAHPFKVCGNSTTNPEYVIDVGLDLTPSGYDLYHSTYSIVYYGPQNTTIYCTTT